MSAAEPAPHLGAVTRVPGAHVIDITTRQLRQTPLAGRWTMEDTTPDGEQDAVQALAEHIETTFTDHGMSLSNDDTAAAFVLTLEIAQGVMRSAQANGIVDEAQCAELDELLEGMKGVPGQIA